MRTKKFSIFQVLLTTARLTTYQNHSIMKRILFTITLLSVSFLATFAQKETFFADKTSVPVSISNLQGVSAEVEMQVYGKNYSPRTLFPVKISYFNEIKLGKSTSLMFSGGLSALLSVACMFGNFAERGC